MRLKDKIALVTGAASGFGAGIAERFAAEGAKVAVVDINAEGARAEAQKIGANAVAVIADLTKAEEVDRAVGETLAAFGGLDIVVNNAGWTHRNKPILEVTEAEFDRIYAINVKAIYLMTQRTTPVLGIAAAAASSTSARPPACARARASPGTMARRVS